MSENIFTELYNKILGLFGQTVQTKEDSQDSAVNRLRLVLMQDRTNLTPEIMHRMRTELIGVLSKYVELDKEALELNFEQEGEQMALMLSIPVIRAKDEEEIEKAIKEEEEEEEETSEPETSSEELEADKELDSIEDEKQETSKDESPEEENQDEEIDIVEETKIEDPD